MATALCRRRLNKIKYTETHRPTTNQTLRNGKKTLKQTGENVVYLHQTLHADDSPASCVPSQSPQIEITNQKSRLVESNGSLQLSSSMGHMFNQKTQPTKKPPRRNAGRKQAITVVIVETV